MKTSKYLTYGIIGLVIVIIIIFVLFASSRESKEEIKKEELILETTNITVKANEQVQIKASVLNNPNPSIKYLSMDNDIIMVSETGLVKGLKLGNAYVSVSYIDNTGNTQTKSCFVTVTYNDTYVVENLTLPTGDIVLKVGDIHKINYEVTPPNDFYLVSYKSTDPSIATIDDDGNITGFTGSSGISPGRRYNVSGHEKTEREEAGGG